MFAFILWIILQNLSNIFCCYYCYLLWHTTCLCLHGYEYILWLQLFIFRFVVHGLMIFLSCYLVIVVTIVVILLTTFVDVLFYVSDSALSVFCFFPPIAPSRFISYSVVDRMFNARYSFHFFCFGLFRLSLYFFHPFYLGRKWFFSSFVFTKTDCRWTTAKLGSHFIPNNITFDA